MGWELTAAGVSPSVMPPRAEMLAAAGRRHAMIIANTAGSSMRPGFHTMLYGSDTGDKIGWARPAETEAMLACDTPFFTLRAPAGSGDCWMWPAVDNFWFWSAWYDRRGQGLEFADGWHAAGLPYPVALEPEITFYLGSHRPWWLWSGDADFPLCVSYSTLRDYRRLPRGRVPWILDSRGFSELSSNGRWTIPLEEYLTFTARADEQIGGLQWAAPQDHMCEEAIIYGGMAGNVPCAGTRQFIDPHHRMSHDELIGEHQRLTTDGYLQAVRLWPRFSRRPCPVIPVLQGDEPRAYLRHYRMYLAAGVDLGDCPVTGVGSVCRLQSTGQIGAVAAALNDLNLNLHWFGLKLTGLQRPEIQRPAASRYAYAGTQSMDSASWSFDARYGKRHPACTHISPKTGRPTRCTNCPVYAGWWRDQVIASMSAAELSPARRLTQAELFPAGPGQRRRADAHLIAAAAAAGLLENQRRTAARPAIQEELFTEEGL